MLGEKFKKALVFAVEAHDGQVRKTSAVPYASHPLQVAGIALEHGADEDQAVAALLHDVIEDTHYTHADLAREFGPRVAEVVRNCSDAEGPDDKGAWRPRKERYLAHLRTCDADTALVSCADKLHNARTLLTELRASGSSVWERFTGARDGSLWYYQEVVRALEPHDLPTPLLDDLRRTVAALVAQSYPATGA